MDTALSSPVKTKKRISKISDIISDNRVIRKSDWPGVPMEEIGHELVKKGTNFVADARNILLKKANNQDDKGGLTLLEKFIRVYKDRPDKENVCGVRINHALALFTAVSYLKPTLVIESGVNAGQSTYFIRAASATTRIMAIDPLETPICGQEKRWIDPTKKTEYLTGDNFKDLRQIDWDALRKEGKLDPETTFLFLDDHFKVLKRLPAIMKAGIRHVMVEDNYKHNKGASSRDRAGMTPKQVFYTKGENSQWMYANIKSYAEFPPLIPSFLSPPHHEVKPEGGFMGAHDDNLDTVEPILRPDVDSKDMELYQGMAKALDMDWSLMRSSDYDQFMNYNFICYLELVPFPSLLRSQFEEKSNET